MFRSALLLIGVLCSPMFAATWYAKPSAGGLGDCSSWSNSCTLAYAIDVKASLGDSVWVTAGTYAPITLKNGVMIIGGFGGTETAASQSNPALNVTTIDGTQTARCVISSNHGATTVLRGFRLRNGKDSSFDGGGGVLVDNSATMFVQCLFEDNTAVWWGGAVAIRGGSAPQFVNCEFRRNGQIGSVLTIAGGAVYIDSGSGTFTNCLFHHNKAGDGGGLANKAGSVTLINSTLAQNEATVSSGGGFFDPEGQSVVRNSILWGNTAVREGTQVFNFTGTGVTAINCSDVQGNWTGTGNIASDPNFTNPSADDYTLLQTTPCKNTGQNSYLPSDLADLDWDGNTTEALPKDLGVDNRKREQVVDMGAFETPPSTE